MNSLRQQARVVPDPRVVTRVLETGLTAAANVVGTLARHRELSDRLAALYQYLVFDGTTPRREREIVILRAAWVCRSEYVFGQHTLYGADAGLTDEEVVGTTQPPFEHAWSTDDRTLLSLADELLSTWTITEPTWAGLAARWSDDQIIELATCALGYAMVSGLANGLGVERDDGVPGFPCVLATAEGAGPLSNKENSGHED